MTSLKQQIEKKHDELKNIPCWCYAKKTQIKVTGTIVGKRQAELLEVLDCELKKCSERNGEDCLIGKVREGVWQ